jgi:hypothetical protein
MDGTSLPDVTTKTPDQGREVADVLLRGLGYPMPPTEQTPVRPGKTG